MGSEAQSVLLAGRGESRDARRVVEGGSPSTTTHSVSIRKSCGALFGEAPRTTESFGSLLTAKAPWCRGRWAYRPTRWLLDEASADSRPAGRPDGRCVCWGFGLTPERGSRADPTASAQSDYRRRESSGPRWPSFSERGVAQPVANRSARGSIRSQPDAVFGQRTVGERCQHANHLGSSELGWGAQLRLNATG
jgi:hypothetical protein